MTGDGDREPDRAYLSRAPPLLSGDPTADAWLLRPYSGDEDLLVVLASRELLVVERRVGVGEVVDRRVIELLEFDVDREAPALDGRGGNPPEGDERRALVPLPLEGVGVVAPRLGYVLAEWRRFASSRWWRTMQRLCSALSVSRSFFS